MLLLKGVESKSGISQGMSCTTIIQQLMCCIDSCTKHPRLDLLASNNDHEPCACMPSRLYAKPRSCVIETLGSVHQQSYNKAAVDEPILNSDCELV